MDDLKEPRLNEPQLNSELNEPGLNSKLNDKLNNVPRAWLPGSSFNMIIRTVVLLYIIWVGVMVGDLMVCRLDGLNNGRLNGGRNDVGLNDGGRNDVDRCRAQIDEVKGAVTTVTVGLMGWLSDSPMR